MNMMKNTVFAALGLLLIVSCNKDDDGGVSIQPPREFDEVALESNEIFKEYLETHFYNYEDFQTNPADFNNRIIFDTIAGANADKIPLSEQVITKIITRGGVEHELHILVAREGSGEKPHFSDSTYVNYSGNVPYESRFDFSATPVWFDLGSAAPAAELYVQNPNALDGFANALPEFGCATSISEDTDGTLIYSDDYGIGAVFIPTGLAYYNSGSARIGAYDNLIFTFDLISFRQTDHDGDGIPSYLEDINANNYVNDLGDDTDGDRVPNYLDSDDDGDGILTRDEIDFDENGNAIRPFRDSNSDGTPDYLDSDN